MAVPDALSRRADHTLEGEDDNEDMVLLPETMFIKSIDFDLKKKMENPQSRDQMAANIMSGIRDGTLPRWKQMKDDWKWEDDLLLYKGRVYVLPDEELRKEIVRRHHDLPVMGHPGQQKTAELVLRDYYWPGIRNYITKYVEGCAICQQNKVITHPTVAPLMPLKGPTSTHPFSQISVDFVTDLPLSNDFDSLMVVVDHGLSKGVILIPCTKTIDAIGTAKLIHDNVYRRFGLHDRMISDRGPQFSSAVAKELSKILGVQLALSTAYHPQTDGETECVN